MLRDAEMTRRASEAPRAEKIRRSIELPSPDREKQWLREGEALMFADRARVNGVHDDDGR